jgi:hypothetical protein
MVCESFCDYKSEKFIMVIDQGCPNHTFEGVFLHPDLRYFQLKYDSDIWQVKETKKDPRNFFGARVFSGGFKMGHQSKNFTPGF